MSESNQSPDPVHDPDRLLTLQATRLLDSPREEAFERCTRLGRRALQAPIVLVSLVDDDRQFFKAQAGVPEPWASERETPLSHSFCQHVVRSRDALIVSDARCHELLHDNRAIADLGVVSYLGIPLRTQNQQILGSLCAMDTQPRDWSYDEAEMMRDLAQGVASEIELRLLASDSLNQLRALQELEHERDELVHMMVHDLRNPLTSVMAGLDMMAENPQMGDEQRKYLNWALRGSDSLLDKINEILTLNKADAGGLEIEQEKLDPEPLLEAAVDQLQHLARASGIAITMDPEEALPEVMGDYSQLERVLVNLIANAIESTDSGGAVEVHVRQDQGAALVFSVLDNGAGFPAGAEESIFDKYRQLKTENRQKQGGSGLGLPFCKRVVEAHGGEISAANRTGGGACFTFSLPLHEPA